MKAIARFVAEALRLVASASFAFLLAALWFALGVLAVAQVYVLSTNEVAVPQFLLRRFEARLADAGLKATFERAIFDPTGRILMHAPKVFVPGYADPVVTARAAYVGLNPWMLAVGQIEPSEIRLIAGTVLVPAMLSPSGRGEPIVRDVDALIVPGSRALTLRHVTGRVSTLNVSVRGAVAYRRGERRPREDISAVIRVRFAEFCRMATALSQQLQRFEEPSVDIELSPSPTRGATATVGLSARGFRIDSPFVAQIADFSLRTQFPLQGDALTASRVDVAAREVTLPKGVVAGRLNAVVTGQFNPVGWRAEPVEVQLTADSVRTPEGVAEAVSCTARPRTLWSWDIEAVARMLGSEISVRGLADVNARTATLQAVANLSPRVMDAVNARAGTDVRHHFDFREFGCELARIEFGPGWKFQRMSAHVALRGIWAHGVAMDEGRAYVELDPKRLYAPVAYARIGENFARGSYEHDFATREFRFLLDGQLRPLAISGFFREWWSRFFHRFEFPARPPVASVDVHGFWGEGWRTSVFVFADAASPVVMTQPLTRVRTRLFIRPGFFDGLELFGVDDSGGSASGTFTVTTNQDTSEWRSVEFKGESTLPLSIAARIAGTHGEPFLSPFELERAPSVKARGRFDGPDVPEENRRRSLDLEVQSAGAFKFHHLLLSDVSFTAVMRDRELTLKPVAGGFAGGVVTGHAIITNLGAKPRLMFEGSLQDASLGVAVSTLQNFFAARQGLPNPPPGKFVQEKANVRLNITALAEGYYSDPFTYHGAGNASLNGPEIGELPLLGQLSELLKFTALRFTTAAASFILNGSRLEFPELTLRGANSAIDAHGHYALDRRDLEFRARVFPFQESGNVIKSVVGAVLTPISNALEVKLTGTLADPDWAFVMGPTNILRSLAADPSENASEQTATTPADPAAGTPEPVPATPQPAPQN